MRMVNRPERNPFAIEATPRPVGSGVRSVPLAERPTTPSMEAVRPLVSPPRRAREPLVSISNEGPDLGDRPTPLLPCAPTATDLGPKDRAVLTRLEGASAGEALIVSKEGFQMGRGRDAGVVVDDDAVSRCHAAIKFEENVGYVLVDLASRNGTTVGGIPVTRHVLEDGDVIRMGQRNALRFSFIDEQHEGLLRHLYQSSTCDMLTGAFNRRHFDERFSAEVAYAVRHQTPLGLVVFDLDHFKKVNDTHGHAAGDAVLKHVAAIVTPRLRNEDVFARYGGEEFVVLLRGIDLAGTARAAERLRGATSGARPFFEGKLIPVSISAGCATLTECAAPTTEALFALADRRLYLAKGAGRNRVASAG